MTGLGLAATAAAYLNYQNAKRNYEQIEERSAGVNAVVNRYQQILDEWEEKKWEDNRDKSLDELNAKRVRPDGLMVGVLVRVGNLVGKLLRTETTLTISNTSSKSYYIRRVQVDNKIWDVPFDVIDWKSKQPFDTYKEINQEIRPGQTIEIIFSKGIGSVFDMDGNMAMDKLRNTICEAAGKKLITSCPKINLDRLATSNVFVWWCDPKDQQDLYKKSQSIVAEYGNTVAAWDKVLSLYNCGTWLNLPAVLRYCGEAYL